MTAEIGSSLPEIALGISPGAPIHSTEVKDIMQFRRTNHPKSVMFAVSYDDGRTAYLVIENHGKASDDYLVRPIAKERQEQGMLPEGEITSIKRVR